MSRTTPLLAVFSKQCRCATAGFHILFRLVLTLCVCLQPILVYRGKKDKKRKGALQQIIERVQAKKENTSFPPILIFPSVACVSKRVPSLTNHPLSLLQRGNDSQHESPHYVQTWRIRARKPRPACHHQVYVGCWVMSCSL